jgi:drug/metabolite transporter (DMT)-like permease
MARRPVWIAGVAADGLAFVAQAAALGIGSLAVVQPLLVASVVFALPLGAWLTDQRVGRREVVAALALLAGLGAFIVVADPAGGRDSAPLGAWLIAAAACGGPCVALTLLAPRAPGPHRAALLGAAAGILFALSAALTKTVVSELDNGLVTLITTWPLYGLIAVGYVSMTLNQMSLDAGALAATVATSTALDPIASVVLGLTLFHESFSADPIEAVVIVLALAVVVGAMIVLAREQAESSPVARA